MAASARPGMGAGIGKELNGGQKKRHKIEKRRRDNPKRNAHNECSKDLASRDPSSITKTRFQRFPGFEGKAILMS